MSYSYDDDGDLEERIRLPGPRPHSGLGWASFGISILCGISLFVLIMIAGVLSIQAGGQMNDQDPQAVILGLLILGSMALSLVGFALGIAGCMQSDRNRTLAILGCVINGMIILGVLGLCLIGLFVG